MPETRHAADFEGGVVNRDDKPHDALERSFYIESQTILR
jgi:hypothetical protein